MQSINMDEVLEGAPRITHIIPSHGAKEGRNIMFGDEWLAIRVGETAITSLMTMSGLENTQCDFEDNYHAPFTLIRSSLEKMGFSNPEAIGITKQYIDAVATRLEGKYGLKFPWRTKKLEEERPKGLLR